MLGHIGLHARLTRAALLALLVVAGAIGCGGASPSVKVLGVQEARRAPTQKLLVFVEVVNPTQRDL
ncbi:MAG TPA: hypothetical protein VKZ63_02465, partial [Kofleriaceae bacterium]|nr:hypothetical protein [Kofleriaceae bacterium]